MVHAGVFNSSGQFPESFGQRISGLTVQDSLGHIAHTVQERAAARKHNAFKQIAIHAGALQFGPDIEKQLFGARFEDFVQLAAARLARRTAFGREGTSMKLESEVKAEQRAAVLLFQAFGVFVGDFKNRGDVASEMVGPDRDAGGEQQSFSPS